MKKEYTTPSVQRVLLKAEEAVLTACKSTPHGGTGAYMGGLGFGGQYGNCQQIQGPTTRCNITGS